MQFEKWYDIDLLKPRHFVPDLGFPTFEGDNNSVRIGVNVYSDRAEETVTGTIKGYVILPNGVALVPFDGASDGNKAWIDLPDDALVMEGRIKVSIRCFDGDETTVLFQASATVCRVDSTAHYDPEDEIGDITDLIADAEQAAQDAEAALAQATAVVSYVDQSAEAHTDTQKAQARANIGAASDGEVSSLKSAFNHYLSGDLPLTIIKDEYVKTDGVVAPYTGWDRTDYIPVSQYYGIYFKTSVASGYNCWYDANKQKIGNNFNIATVGRVVTIPDGAVYLMMSNSAEGMQNLEARYITNIAQDVANTSDAVSDIKKAMDGYSLVTYSLPADSAVGNNWNNTYVMAIPAGTRLILRFNGYSGANFTRFAVFGNKEDESSTELKTFYTNTVAEIEIVTTEAYTGLYLSLVRSAAESPVEYSISVKADIGTMLGHDILNLTEQAAELAKSDAYINANLSGIAYAHFNLFDMCAFDDGYVYNAAGEKVEAASNSVATPIRVEAGTTYYAKNTRLYFSFFIYEDGTNARIGNSDSVTSGAFVPTKSGYAYLTVVTGNKSLCVFTKDQALYESSRTASYYVPNKLELGIEGSHIFHVGAGRDYTSLLEGIIAAEQFKNSIVYVDPGTYDMVQEFKDKYGSGYFTTENYLTQENHRGCPLTNGVHVIGYGGVTVTGGLQSTDSQDAIGDWSIFSAGDDAGGDNGYGFTLENITIKSTSQHIRYLVHDEYGLTNYNYINKYLNIHFIVFPGYVKRCIGGGLGSHGYILIDNCTISAPAYDATIRGINYHNDANTGALNEIYIKNCYIPNGTVGITWYGQTPATEKSMLYVNNCYLQAEPVKKAETESAPYENVDIVSWCNTIAP